MTYDKHLTEIEIENADVHATQPLTVDMAMPPKATSGPATRSEIDSLRLLVGHMYTEFKWQREQFEVPSTLAYQMDAHEARIRALHDTLKGMVETRGSLSEAVSTLQHLTFRYEQRLETIEKAHTALTLECRALELRLAHLEKGE